MTKHHNQLNTLLALRRSIALRVALVHFGGAFIFIGLQQLLSWDVVRAGLLRLCWSLGPWPSFPILQVDWLAPYDRALSWQDELAMIAIGALTLATLVLFLYTLVFWVVVLAHRRWGWPRYWAIVRPSISLYGAWMDGAVRAWWIFPAVMGLYDVWFAFSEAFRIAMNATLIVGPEIQAAFLAITLAEMARCSAVAIRRHIGRAVAPHDRRCETCDYALRGLASAHCPECGRPFDTQSQPTFFLRSQRWPWPHARRRLLVLAFVAVLLSPLWIPWSLRLMPAAWVRVLPMTWPFVLNNRHPNAFPVRMDTICVITRGNERGAVSYVRTGWYRARIRTAYWSDNARAMQHPPDEVKTFEYGAGPRPQVTIGPWPVSMQWGTEEMMFLFRPNAEFNVDGMLPEEFTSDTSWLPVPRHPVLPPGP